MKVLLDTHFILWAVARPARLKRFPWIDKYMPWGISPVSMLEIQFLGELGKLDLRPGFFEALESDPRFVVDEPPLVALVGQAMSLGWTHDPFDRLLAAHSRLRRVPFASTDELVSLHHPLLVRELRD